VNAVLWFEAALYCNARSNRDGLDTVYSYDSASIGTYGLAGLAIDLTKNGYRLPTEAEWEYACRAGSTTDYYWGRNYPPTTRDDTLAIDSNAIWSGGILGGHYNDWQRAAGKKPNAFGLYDMIGNAMEWCNDVYDPYDSAAQTDPTGPSSGSFRVLRGGAWYDTDPFLLRSARRFCSLPSLYGQFSPGFRCVRR
jgi:formylglycine-generating enzyme required for sulfatase activity